MHSGVAERCGGIRREEWAELKHKPCVQLNKCTAAARGRSQLRHGHGAADIGQLVNKGSGADKAGLRIPTTSRKQRIKPSGDRVHIQNISHHACRRQIRRARCIRAGARIKGPRSLASFDDVMCWFLFSV